ncbi:hypothetical protein HII36_30085, partial [Nonomuraea sp. NN258]|nr:hypothetical protein [Nonomuraea antri]
MLRLGVAGLLEILATGPLTTVQDLGRPGLGHLGVGRSGAADRGALRLANRLLANPEDAAALEVTLGGLRVRAHGDLTIALTGAPCPAYVIHRPAHLIHRPGPGTSAGPVTADGGAADGVAAGS